MKPRKKYAAIGEQVRIVTPKEFVRCGYPLTIKIIMEQQFEEIEKDCARMFAALEKKPAPPTPSEPGLVTDWGFTIPGVQVSDIPAMSATVHGMLCAAIAAYRLEQQNFGGNIRLIVERDGVCDPGDLAVVIKKSLVKTGKRIASWGGQDQRTGEWDYEPGGLENEQTHCVYTVQKNNFKFKILAEHCELLSNGEKP
jgi:hypothetical protein